MLTSKGGKQDVVTALENGADDYVVKPFDREELQARIRAGLRIVGLQTSHTVVYTFARAVEAKSPFTQGHSDRVTQLALVLAERLGVAAAEREVLRSGALLHDIGKLGIPDAILNKAGPLTAEEYDIIKQHPMQGVRMVESLQSMAGVIPLIRWHHERLDGSGYPDGLQGDEIPPLVRILSVADSYDAMASDRPYRPGMPHAECIHRLQRDAAKRALERSTVEAFCAIPLTLIKRPFSAVARTAQPDAVPVPLLQAV
jgi:putative two-component system response regulator